jgi:peptidoglycan/xylan/chitin deacetylase (PgdA/CDA1 family)
MTRTLLLFLTATSIAVCQESTPSLQQRQADRLPYAPPSLVLKQPPRLQPVQPIVVPHGPRDKRVIALTFDACSTKKPSHYDERITNILIETKTPATLFLGGKWMEEEIEQTKYLASIPYFELGNHTFLHPHLLTMSDDRIRQELSWTQEVMYSLTGKQPTLFRSPYGEEDDRVVRIAASMGLRTIQFDLASGDPDSSISKEKLIAYVSSMAKSGSIIVMHINMRGWHTAEALPEIISRLRKRGFTFVTVGELLSQMHPTKSAKEKAGD